MVKFQNPTFQSPGNNKKYSDNYDRIFDKEAKFLQILTELEEKYPEWSGTFCMKCGCAKNPPEKKLPKCSCS